MVSFLKITVHSDRIFDLPFTLLKNIEDILLKSL